MVCLPLLERVVGERAPLNHFALFVVQFSPCFQPAFIAARATILSFHK